MGGEERGTLELRTDGRRAPVRLLFVEDRGGWSVVPSVRDAEWFSRAVRDGGVTVRPPGGAEQVCRTEVVPAGPEFERVRRLFQEKYGASIWPSYFGRATLALALDPSHPPAPPSPDRRLVEEFDAAAGGYDAGVASRPVERYLKERVAEVVERAFVDEDPILEVGPGTGFHTLRLLDAGHRVLAVDVSRKMLERLQRHAAERGSDGRLEVREGRLRDLSALLADRPPGAFGGAFSAFGPFNLEPELREACAALTRLVGPKGHLIFTSLNRPGLFPMVWEIASGSLSGAFRRTAAMIPVGGVRYPLSLYVPTIKGWDTSLSPGFRREAVGAVSVLAPPFDSERSIRWLGTRGLSRLGRLDRRLAGIPGSWVGAEWILLRYVRGDRSDVHQD